MKTIIFARVSSKEQEETGYSLPAQEKLLKDYAEKKGLEVSKSFSVSESASGRHQRKSFEEMIAYSKENNIKIIVCEKVDRLTRNLKSAVLINEWLEEDTERQVHFVKESCVLDKNSKSHDKFIWNIKISTSQFYIDNLSEEVKKGQMEKIRQGWIPCKAKLGYKTIGEKGHKTQILDENKSLLVKRMFDLYARGDYSLKKLSQAMYEEGLRTAQSNKLVISRMANLLADPFYCGKIRWNEKTYDGQHEPIVDAETFEKVQEVLKGKTTPKCSKHIYLFKGIVRCAECGGVITWEKHKGIVYGHCNYYYRNCSRRDWFREDDTVEQLLPYFNALVLKDKETAELIKETLLESHKEQSEYHDNALRELNIRQAQIDKRLSAIYDDKLDGKITPAFYEQKLKQYTEEKGNILISIEKHNNAQAKYFQLGVNLLDISQQAGEIFQKVVIEKERDLLNLIFQNFSLNRGKLEAIYTKPFQALADFAKESNKILEPAKMLSFPTKTSKNEAFDLVSDKLLAWRDAFRNYDWEKAFPSPEATISQVKQLLALV